VPSGGAAEVRDILEKHNLHSTSELEESDNWLVLVRMSSMAALGNFSARTGVSCQMLLV
jgi:hypothetical protein